MGRDTPTISPDQQRKPTPMERLPTTSGTANLLDILDRVLDKGLVIAGDIRVSLANVELLTIKIRLLVCSVDKAEQIGLNWWKFDPNLTQPALLGEAPRTRIPPQAAVIAPPPPGRRATVSRTRTVTAKKKTSKRKA
jgi:hypothetical protein